MSFYNVEISFSEKSRIRLYLDEWSMVDFEKGLMNQEILFLSVGTIDNRSYIINRDLIADTFINKVLLKSTEDKSSLISTFNNCYDFWFAIELFENLDQFEHLFHEANVEQARRILTDTSSEAESLKVRLKHLTTAIDFKTAGSHTSTKSAYPETTNQIIDGLLGPRARFDEFVKIEFDDDGSCAFLSLMDLQFISMPRHTVTHGKLNARAENL